MITLGGATTIGSDAGTLILSNTSTIQGATAASNLTLTGSGNGSIAGIINGGTGGTAGAGTLTMNGSGAWTLSGTNTFTGGTTLNSGTLIAASQFAFGNAATDTITLNGGVLDMADGTASLTEGNNVTVAGNAKILTDRSGLGAGISHTLGTLSIGSNKLTIDIGPNVTSASGNVARINTLAVTLTGNPTFDTEDGALLILGVSPAPAISGNGNITVQSGDGTGLTSIRGTTNSTAKIQTTLASGTLTLNSSTTNPAVGSLIGSPGQGSTLVLNGGTLDLQVDAGVSAYPATVGGNATITTQHRGASNSPASNQFLGTPCPSARTR